MQCKHSYAIAECCGVLDTFSHKSKAQHHKAAVKKINSVLSRASAMLQMMLQCYMHIHKHISFHFFYVDQHGEES